MRKAAVLALCAALAGCSRMPEYRRPEPPVPARWAQPASEAGQRATGIAWRDFFPDARLRALIDLALEHNRDLRIALARVEEARAQFGIVRADRLPTLDLAASGSLARTPAELSLSRQAATGERYDVGLSVPSFELDFWGRVKSLDEAARASYLATEEARRALRLSLIADVADAYLALLEMEERARLARATVATRERARLMVTRRRDVGLAGELDVLQAGAALELARAELADLERQREAAANALVLLTGREPPELPPGRTLADQAIVTELAAGVPSEVLLDRPDVLAAEQRLKAANADIGAARAAFLPRISLTAGLGTASGALAGLFAAGSGAWSFQPVLRLPLFDAGRTGAAADLAQARRLVAVAQYEKTIQQAFREVADLLAARTHLAAQLQARIAAQRTQAQRLSLAQSRYAAGISSYLEVLDAQRDAFAAEQATVQARRATLAAAVRLYEALGGGQH